MTKRQYHVCWDDPLLDDAGLHTAVCPKWKDHDLIASGGITISRVAVADDGSTSEHPITSKEAHSDCSQVFDSLLSAIEAVKAVGTRYMPCSCCTDEYLDLSANINRA